MLDSVKISKPVELNEIDYAIRHVAEAKSLEADQTQFEEKKKVPKGKCTPDDLVDIITVITV